MYKKYVNLDVFGSADANAIMRQSNIALEGVDVTAANSVDTPYDGMKVVIAGITYTRHGSAWISEFTPNPQTSYGISAVDISSTSWSMSPGTTPVSISTPADLWVDVRFGGALRASGGTAGDVSLSFAVTGSTPISASSIPATIIRHPMGLTTEALSYSGQRVVKLIAGTNSLSLQAKQTGGGTRKVELGFIEVVPLRWSFT